MKIARTIKELQRNTAIAKTELAVLINVPPGTSYTLVADNKSQLPDQLSLTVDQMVDYAIRDRAELRENWYQQRINKKEAYAAFLEMLPGLQVFAGPNLSSNSFLLNANWVSWGAKASWNLLKAFQYPAKYRVIKQREKVLHTRALAMTITIMAQVHISRISYFQRKQELEANHEYLVVQKRLMRQLRSEAAAHLVSENKLLREELATLVAEAKYDVAHAAAQAAYANLFATIGREPFKQLNTQLPVDTISLSLQQSWQGANLSQKASSLGVIAARQHFSRPAPVNIKKPIITSGIKKIASGIKKARKTQKTQTTKDRFFEDCCPNENVNSNCCTTIIRMGFRTHSIVGGISNSHSVGCPGALLISNCAGYRDGV